MERRSLGRRTSPQSAIPTAALKEWPTPCRSASAESLGNRVARPGHASTGHQALPGIGLAGIARQEEMHERPLRDGD